MRILVFADAYSIHTERWIEGLALNPDNCIYLVSMNPAGVRPSIAASDKIQEIHTICPKNIRAEGGNFSYLLNIPKIWRILRDIAPDVINAHYLTSYGFIAALLKGNRYLLSSLHGTDIWGAARKNFAYRAVTRFALRRSDLVVSVSKVMTEEVLAVGKIDSSKVVTQQYGIDESLFDAAFTKKEIDFFSNRAWVANSNIPNMLEAFHQLGEEYKLTLLHEGGSMDLPIRGRLQGMQNIKHVGYVPHKENLALLSKSKFFISLPTTDGASLSLLEAMALGAVPIASDVPANREWIEHRKNGFLVDPTSIAEISGIIREARETSAARLSKMVDRNRQMVRERGSFSNNMTYLCNLIENAFKRNELLTWYQRG
jgi:glycosyltransferase involved in cell wall biosynthesis